MITLLVNVFLVWVCWKQLTWYNKHQRPLDLEFGSYARACLITGEKITAHKYPDATVAYQPSVGRVRPRASGPTGTALRRMEARAA